MDNKVAGEIGKGYVVFLGVKEGDTEDDARYLAHKTANLRVFSDNNEKMNLSIQDVDGEILVISQFTLYANTKKGNRPSFTRAAPPDVAAALYEVYIDALRRAIGDNKVATGAFRAMMRVEIINDGPVTVELTTDA